MPKVRFLRSNVEVEVETGANLRQVAKRNGVQLYPGIHRFANCRGLAQCGSCRVLLENGTENNAGPKTFLEKVRLAVAFFNIGQEEKFRLACQTKVMGDLEVLERPPTNVSGTYAAEAEAAKRRIAQGKL